MPRPGPEAPWRCIAEARGGREHRDVAGVQLIPVAVHQIRGPVHGHAGLTRARAADDGNHRALSSEWQVLLLLDGGDDGAHMADVARERMSRRISSSMDTSVSTYYFSAASMRYWRLSVMVPRMRPSGPGRPPRPAGRRNTGCRWARAVVHHQIAPLVFQAVQANDNFFRRVRAVLAKAIRAKNGFSASARTAGRPPRRVLRTR
jgi:hypothetical protein